MLSAIWLVPIALWLVHGYSDPQSSPLDLLYFALTALFSVLESIIVGFSQVFYECIHLQHHKGNSDRPGRAGDTVDWISIYKHGNEGEAEHPLKYTFLSFFREDPKTVYRQLKRKGPREAFWGVAELTLFVSTFAGLGILNWHYICFLLPFYYFGHCLSYLNRDYRHYGGNPDEPLAWGVSSYGKLYNWIWFFNGYHAEHHFRPKVHWVRMQALREQILEQQRVAGVRVIKPPHALGFLDPDLPSRKSEDRFSRRVQSESA